MYIHILPMCLQYNKKYNSKYVCSEEESFDIYDLVPNIKYNSIKNTTEKKKSSILKTVKRSTGKMIKQLVYCFLLRFIHRPDKRIWKNTFVEFIILKTNLPVCKAPPCLFIDLEKKTNKWLLDFEGRKGMNDPYENIIRYYV